jgi:NADPH:quinone reductase-like Zn-dependent oxidoreductase
VPPETTTAIRIERHGSPEKLVEREVPLGTPGPGEALIRVDAAGVNFADLMMRAGLYRTVPPRPYSPGFEIAGEVLQAGPGVTGWRQGDRAVALLRHGGYAQHVIVRTAQLFRYPDRLEPSEAAAIPVVFLTAWVCLLEAARARAGETVLVLGAGGGVGTALVQLARRSGLRVIGTAGDTRKRCFVTDALGAEACFDSRGDWEGGVRQLVGERGIDLALDPVGGRATASCRRLLAPLGRLVFYGLSEALPTERRRWLQAARAWFRTPRIHPYSLIELNHGIFGVHLLHLGPREELLTPALEEVYDAVAAGELRAVVDRVFPFTRDGAVAAHHYLHARRNLGKVVLAHSVGGRPARPSGTLPVRG